jgi:hypothetical protein
VHFWCIKERTYLGFRDVRGPKWESWIPANHFDNHGGDHRILIPRNATHSVELNFIVDVYHPNDVRLREGNWAQQMLPPHDWVFFVVHGGHTLSVHHSTSAIAFACSVANMRRQPGEFLRSISMGSCEALTLCIREVVRGLQAICSGISPDIIGTLDQTSVALATRATRASLVDAAVDARDVAVAARDVAVAAHAAFHVALDAAAPDAVILHAALDEYSADAAANAAANAALEPAIQCSGVFKDQEIFQIPCHLVSPLLVHGHTKCRLCYQSGAFRAVLGGHPHPFDRNTWVPICVLHSRLTQSDSAT